MAEIGVKLGGDNSAFRGMLDDSASALVKFGRSFSSLIPVLSAGGLVSFFKTVASEAGALQDLSDRLGVSTDSLQAFNFVVREAGGTTEQSTMTWDRARKAIDALAAGTPEVVEQFQKLGLSAKDFVGVPLEKALERIAVAYRDNATAAGSYDAINDILGTRTLPRVLEGLLKIANEGLPAVTEAGKKAGQIGFAPDIKVVDEFGDALGRVWAMAKNVGISLLAMGIEAGKVPSKIGEALGEGLNPSPFAKKGPRSAEEFAAEQAAKAAAEQQKQADKKANTELAAAFAEVDAAKKGDEEKAKSRAKLEKENEAAAEKAMKAKKAEEDADDKRNAAQNKAMRDIVDAEYKLVQLALERAKAEGKVTSEFSKQLSEIQKMGGAGQGGFKAGAGGGGEGTTTVAALENVLTNAKNAVEYAYKNVNAADGARNLVEAKALVDQAEKNLLTARGKQGFGSPVEVKISDLDFTSLQQTSDAAFGSREQNAIDRQLLDVAKQTKMSTDEIKSAVKYIESQIKE